MQVQTDKNKTKKNQDELDAVDDDDDEEEKKKRWKGRTQTKL